MHFEQVRLEDARKVAEQEQKTRAGIEVREPAGWKTEPYSVVRPVSPRRRKK